MNTPPAFPHVPRRAPVSLSSLAMRKLLLLSGNGGRAVALPQPDSDRIRTVFSKGTDPSGDDDGSHERRLHTALPVTCLADLCKKPVPTKLNNLSPLKDKQQRLDQHQHVFQSCRGKPLRCFPSDWLPRENDVIVTFTTKKVFRKNEAFSSLIQQSLPNYTEGNATRNAKLVTAILKTVSENQGHFLHFSRAGFWREVDMLTAQNFVERSLEQAASKERQKDNVAASPPLVSSPVVAQQQHSLLPPQDATPPQHLNLLNLLRAQQQQRQQQQNDLLQKLVALQSGGHALSLLGTSWAAALPAATTYNQSVHSVLSSQQPQNPKRSLDDRDALRVKFKRPKRSETTR